MAFEKFKTFMLIVLFDLNMIDFVCVHGASLRSDQPDTVNNKPQQKLDAADILIESLAIDVCLDLQIYNNETSLEDCQKNFINSQMYKTGDPPEVTLTCQYQSNVVFNVDEIKDPAVWTLVVLKPHTDLFDFLPYDLITSTDKRRRTLELFSLDQYTTWTTRLYEDGSHTRWLRGPEIRPWNITGDLPQRRYNIELDMDHELINGSSSVNAYFTWKSFDDDDICFDLVNYCDAKLYPIRLTSSEGGHHGTASLPLGATCSLRLAGKHGATLRRYRTPSCDDMHACIDSSMAQNISVRSEPGESGWDIYVSWTRHLEPLFYNVTLIGENVTRSVQLPGHLTETIFADVEDTGLYVIAIGSVLKDWTVWTNVRAMFPESGPWDGPARAHGAWGAWGAGGALAAGGALLAALACRARHRQPTRHAIYFPEPDDKPGKDGEYDGGDHESVVAEDDWELRSERLLLHEVIGEGAFGVVRRGSLAPAGREVAVKMLKDFPTLDEFRSFRAEMELMKSVGAHPHVVSLVGCCSGRRPFIVAEYCSRGDLLSYLRCSWDVMVSKRNAKYYNNNIETTDYRNDLFKCKPQEEHSKLVVNKLYDLQGICDTDLTTRDLLSFCRQIAMGMEFLASNRLVHRDLAARNVLVSSDRTLKIADFGLSRDVYEENQYKQKGNGKMPMKWMALESLTRRIYTTQSDVWSFGVVMWEVSSVGGAPYADVPPARLPRLLRAGYRMPRPANCTKQLYELMLSCWLAAPRARPTFASLHARLDELLAASAHEYLALEDDAPAAHQGYVAMILRNKFGWSRGDSYPRPMLTAQSNHYSSPPACLHKVQSVS